LIVFGSVTFIFYLSECINFCLYFPHFLTDLGEIRHRISLVVELTYYGLYECRWSGRYTLYSGGTPHIVWRYSGYKRRLLKSWWVVEVVTLVENCFLIYKSYHSLPSTFFLFFCLCKEIRINWWSVPRYITLTLGNLLIFTNMLWIWLNTRRGVLFRC